MVRDRTSIQSPDRQLSRDCRYGRDGCRRLALACLLLLAALASAVVDFAGVYQAVDQSYLLSQTSLFGDDEPDGKNGLEGDHQDRSSCVAINSSRLSGLPSRSLTGDIDRSGASKPVLPGARLARGPPGRSEHTPEARLV
jgi:hypothetical protein